MKYAEIENIMKNSEFKYSITSCNITITTKHCTVDIPISLISSIIIEQRHLRIEGVIKISLEA